MKTTLVAVVLAVAGLTPSLQTAALQSQPVAAPQETQSAAPAQPQTQKQIKNPAEYNAYVSAVQQQDPKAKISGLEAFTTQYPNSVMKEDALELLMGAYQQTGNQAKVMDTIQRLLQANPNNLRGLALITYLKRATADAGTDPQQNLAEAAQYGSRGVEALKTAPKPEGMSDADFDKFKKQLNSIFNGAVGINALQTKDYPGAQAGLRAAVEGDPNDLRNVYPLALADLTGTPPNPVDGLFFIARAATLAAGSPQQAQLESYGKSQYKKYHGSDQGWTDVLAAAKANPLPPQGFTVTKYVPPTPAEQAHDLVKDKTPAELKKLSFAEWQLVLSQGSPEDQDKVWSAIKGVPLQIEATVLKASPTQLDIAASQDDIDAKRADITLTMDGTIPAKLMPAEGSTLDFQGTAVSYTPSPFVMTMEKGALLTKAAPPKKPPVHKRPSQ
jgi:hypothetical protein